MAPLLRSLKVSSEMNSLSLLDEYPKSLLLCSLLNMDSKLSLSGSFKVSGLFQHEVPVLPEKYWSVQEQPLHHSLITKK